ncbi:unnamed protein product [Brachionus calyciflorus]|uniref:Uncharacterized protein n=1 Tax=Brachionus calyciflorus TaxID=104777 RepID=A0A813X102_9BILA|nr:unnamed protein product [Brachionus calyciflorus]
MKRRSLEKNQLTNDSETSLGKKSPDKTSINSSPSANTRSRRSLNNLNNELNKSPTVQFKQELKIETHYIPNQEHPNLPSANSSDFSVVYVDDSDATNQSDFAVINEDIQSIPKKRNNRKKKENSEPEDKNKLAKYKLITCLKEEHAVNVYDVKIYKPFESNPKRLIFAAVGNNQCSIYEYNTMTGDIEPIDVYLDADPEEDFYVCEWTTDPVQLEPLLVCAGNKGIIRTTCPFKPDLKNALIGHGASINDLKFHPTKNFILLSASKDYTLRLWNVNTTVCIAIFGGAEGHTDQVLSAVLISLAVV